MTEPVEPKGEESRKAVRSNIFAMGDLVTQAAILRVKVRNLSVTGALIEGEGLPSANSHVALRVGNHQVDASVVWQSAGKVGLSFDHPIAVADWMPGAVAKQSAVDDAFKAIKLGSSPSGALPLNSSINAKELNGLARATEALADLLSNDKIIVARYLLELQTLDLVAQALRKLSKERR